MTDVSIVIPLFNEDESLRELHAWIRRVTDEHHLVTEIIFIDDGSKDHTWDVVQKFANNDQVVLLQKKNEGSKFAALNYGLKHVTTDIVGCLDADSSSLITCCGRLICRLAGDGSSMVPSPRDVCGNSGLRLSTERTVLGEQYPAKPPTTSCIPDGALESPWKLVINGRAWHSLSRSEGTCDEAADHRADDLAAIEALAAGSTAGSHGRALPVLDAVQRAPQRRHLDLSPRR